MDQHNREALEKLCERLGADPERAPLMANQLIKRAAQVSQEKGITEVQAMEELLRLMLDPQKAFDERTAE